MLSNVTDVNIFFAFPVAVTFTRLSGLMCLRLYYISIKSFSGDYPIHLGQRTVRGHWRRHPLAADGGERRGRGPVLAVLEGEVQEEHHQEASPLWTR